MIGQAVEILFRRDIAPAKTALQFPEQDRGKGFRIPGGVKLTVEAIYTKTIYDVMLQQVNLADTSVKYYAYDVQHLQPIYTGGKNDPNYSSVYL